MYTECALAMPVKNAISCEKLTRTGHKILMCRNSNVFFPKNYHIRELNYVETHFHTSSDSFFQDRLISLILVHLAWVCLSILSA